MTVQYSSGFAHAEPDIIVPDRLRWFCWDGISHVLDLRAVMIPGAPLWSHLACTLSSSHSVLPTMERARFRRSRVDLLDSKYLSVKPKTHSGKQVKKLSGRSSMISEKMMISGKMWMD